MATAFNLESYRFKGIAVEGRAQSLVDAINDLADFWSARSSLVMHAWGVLTLQITIAGREAIFEIADPSILDAIEGGNMQPLIDMLAKDMDLDRRQAEQILEESSEVVATVDRVRPRQRPNAWRAGPGLESQEVLAKATTDWVRNLSQEIDQEVRRGRGRPRSRRGKAIVRMAVDLGKKKKISDTKLSQMTGIPRSTLRDTRLRIERERKVTKTFKDRKRGAKLTKEQESVIISAINRNENNAAEAARELGLAPRTVRDVRTRSQRAARGGARHSNEVKSKLLNIVRTESVSATEAGRRLGIASRTARGWVYNAKWGK